MDVFLTETALHAGVRWVIVHAIAETGKVTLVGSGYLASMLVDFSLPKVVIALHEKGTKGDHISENGNFKGS